MSSSPLDDLSLSELTLEEILDAVSVVGVDGEVLELGGELGEVSVVVLAGVVVVVAVAVAGQGSVDIVRDGSVAAPVLLLLDELSDAEAPGVILLRIVTASHRSLLRLPRVAVVRVGPLSGVAIAGAWPRLEVAGEPACVVPVVVTVRHVSGL